MKNVNPKIQEHCETWTGGKKWNYTSTFRSKTTEYKRQEKNLKWKRKPLRLHQKQLSWKQPYQLQW